jgi:hypothetical protein
MVEYLKQPCVTRPNFIKTLLRISCMVSCRICGKDLENEIPFDHMKDHDKSGEIPHIRDESEQYEKRD